VPRTLRPILELREGLKARAKEVAPEEAAQYKDRQNALKWMLVTCFGYLGYKNARFGKIEAHEAVTAYGRDKLLAAKEICEAAGFRVLHGLTDCLWLQKAEATDNGWQDSSNLFGGPGVLPVRRRVNVHESHMSHPRAIQIPPAPLFQRGGQSPPLEKGDLGGFDVLTVKPGTTPNDRLEAYRYKAELEDLCGKITRATGVKMALEGFYKWIVFLASRQEPTRPVATRYFGVFADGSLKVRGLICRRRDTPPFVRRAQEALLARLGTASTAAELAALRPALEDMAAGFRQRLKEGGVRPRDLVITRRLSQPVEDYKVDTPTALAARQLKNAGILLVPGEKVRYVHRQGKRGPKECRIQAAPFLDSLEDYDAKLYLELLERAIEEVLLPFREEMIL